MRVHWQSCFIIKQSPLSWQLSLADFFLQISSLMLAFLGNCGLFVRVTWNKLQGGWVFFMNQSTEPFTLQLCGTQPCQKVRFNFVTISIYIIVYGSFFCYRKKWVRNWSNQSQRSIYGSISEIPTHCWANFWILRCPKPFKMPRSKPLLAEFHYWNKTLFSTTWKLYKHPKINA